MAISGHFAICVRMPASYVSDSGQFWNCKLECRQAAAGADLIRRGRLLSSLGADPVAPDLGVSRRASAGFEVLRSWGIS